MTQEISFDTYREKFMEYAASYDRADGRVELKIIHTNSVVDIMDQLCKKRGLPKRTANLAMICALFHDIGRFEQLKQYDTFLDHLSCNHGALSCSILKNSHMLDGLSEEDQDMVLTAILNHNRYEIDPAVLDAAKQQPDNPCALEQLELCKLIRDADKCDIFRVFATDHMTDVVGVPEEEIAYETITPAVLQAILEHRCVDKLIRRTYLDFWISFLAFFYDLNYPESVEIAKEQGYYRLPFDRTNFKDPETSRQISELLDEVEHYIREVTDGSCDVTVPEALEEFFRRHQNLALAFSGGTDSAYLLYAAVRCGCKVKAYYVSTPFQPQFELDDAEKLANELGAPMTVLPFDVLAIDAVKKNPADRCYYCKNAIFHLILEAAANDGFQEIMDGTNASDDAGDRPGMRALRELEVLSPLRECGVTKKALREYSRRAGLFTWNKPAYACLATRIPVNTAIEKDMLKNVETAESGLSAMGFTDFRVRVIPESRTAKLQVVEEQLPLLMEKRRDLLDLLGGTFDQVLLDLNLREASVE